MVCDIEKKELRCCSYDGYGYAIYEDANGFLYKETKWGIIPVTEQNCHVLMSGGINYGVGRLKLSTSRLIGKEFERRVAKKVGGIRVPGSGAIVGFPGDVSTDKLLIETKIRSSVDKRGKKITIQKRWLESNINLACTVGKIPILAFKFKYSHEDYGIIEAKYWEKSIIPYVGNVGHKSITLHERDIVGVCSYSAFQFNFKDDCNFYVLSSLSNIVSAVI